MNDLDRKRLDAVEEEVREVYIVVSDVAGDVYEIKTNHLHDIDEKLVECGVKVDKSLFRSAVTIGGLAFIGVMIAILGCMVAFAK